MTPTESLKVLLTTAEHDHIVLELEAAPAGAVYGTFLERIGAALVIAKVDGEVTGYFLTHASDADEGREIARALADRLAREYAEGRDAREAVRLLLKRIAH